MSKLLKELKVRKETYEQDQKDIAAARNDKVKKDLEAVRAEEFHDCSRLMKSVLPEKLKEAASRGQTSVSMTRIDPSDRRMYDTRLGAWAIENGLNFSSRNEYVPAESGDPDSGEGEHGAYMEYIFTLTWK